MASTHALLSNQPHLVGGQTIAGKTLKTLTGVILLMKIEKI